MSHGPQLPMATRRDLQRLVVVIAALLAVVALTTLIVTPLVLGVLGAVADRLGDAVRA
jgi:hypothetical protein